MKNMSTMKTEFHSKEPPVRNDTKGKWRHQVQSGSHINDTVLTNMSWNTKKEAEAWVRWNNFDQGLYGEIIKNPDLVDPS